MFASDEPRRIYAEDGADVSICDRWIDACQSRALFDELSQTPGLAQASMRIYGREVFQPRLSVAYGAAYSYSGARHESRPWTTTLLSLMAKAAKSTGSIFNQAIVQLYRDGSDSIGWHADDEPELGPEPTIVGISFGGPRRMLLRSRGGWPSTPVELTDGSMLVMRGRTQSVAMHSIPKVARAEPRVSVTLRFVRAA